MDKIAIFRPNIELEAIARQSVEASRKVICAYFGNIGRNSGYFLLTIFLGSYLNVQLRIDDLKIETDGLACAAAIPSSLISALTHNLPYNFWRMLTKLEQSRKLKFNSDMN